jgi:adenylate kinase
MPNRLNLIILGKQGAGKGTQCSRLAAHYSIPHVSTGDILRAAIQADSPLGRSVAAILDEGSLVSDDLVVRLVEERFKEPDATGGALLDGFPRTIAQAEALEDLLGDDGIKLCIDLQVSTELAIYNETDIEAISGTCSKCGGDVIQRADDYPEAIRKRLETYVRDTEPLLNFYEARGLLVSVNGEQSPDDVTVAIQSVISLRGLG